jgi:hypothetical protein
MRYYMYISDAKVDMLLPQVPGAQRQQVAAKLGFDIKLLSGSLQTERATLDSRVARAEAVEACILDTESIGTPAQPERWIRGAADARIAHVGDGAIMFVAETPDWMLALGGSAHHLIGSVRREDVSVGYSFLPTMIDLLKGMDEKDQSALTLHDDAPPQYWAAAEVGTGVEEWLTIIKEASRQVTAPPQRIMFLAKRLLSHRLPSGRRVTLGTPLYVALED